MVNLYSNNLVMLSLSCVNFHLICFKSDFESLRILRNDDDIINEDALNSSCNPGSEQVPLAQLGLYYLLVS